MLRCRKAVIMAILSFCCLQAVLAQADDDLFHYHALNLGLTINNSFTLVNSGSGYFVDKASALVHWYPEDDYRQFVEFIKTDPASEFREGKGFAFEWVSPSLEYYSMVQESRLTTTNDYLAVKNKIFFPIKDLDPGYSAYLQAEEVIDINDDIKVLAAGLVDDDNDLYSVVVKLAEWVENNVRYNLSTITMGASKKSSWVLVNKQGVCDELTSLFISMCRSLGIPARFVSGISYSNVNLENDGWGPHGWAEVYFPEVGWVPFDVTYKELGFVDATHIKLRTSIDAKETSVEYSAIGKSVSVRPGPLDFSIDLKGKDHKSRPSLVMNVEAAEPSVGLASYNLVILTVKNPNDFYVAERFSMVNVTELSLIEGSEAQTLLLHPGEEKKLYWLVRADSKNPDFLYTYPIRIKASKDGDAQASFRAGSQYRIFSEEYMRMQIEPRDKGKEPLDLAVSCAPDRRAVYTNETVNIQCSIINEGLQMLNDLRVCLDKECSITSLASQESVNLVYESNFQTLGVKTLAFKVENDNAESSSYVIIDVMDKPLVQITNITYPSIISFSDSSEIKCHFKRISTSTPKNIKVMLDHSLIKEEWAFAALESSYELRFLFKGESLALGKNLFKIILTYEDSEGLSYMTEKDFEITLNDPTLTQKLIIWANMIDVKISRWLTGLID